MISRTITLPATVAAIGLTATGVATAAVPVPAVLGRITAENAAQAPLHTCPMLQSVGRGLEKAPCLDADLGLSTPNRTENADLARAADGALGAARQPDRGLPRTIGGVLPALTAADELAKTRPTVDLDLRPGYPGAPEPGKDLLSTKAGPYRQQHNGVSALGTSADVEAMRGYHTPPDVDPLAMVRSSTGQPTGPTRITDGLPQPFGSAPKEVLDGGLHTVADAAAVMVNAARPLT